MNNDGIYFLISNMIINTNFSKLKLRTYFINKNWQNSFFCLELLYKKVGDVYVSK